MKKIILLLLLSNILYGQDSLSLMDAIKIGLWKNYDIQISTKKQKQYIYSLIIITKKIKIAILSQSAKLEKL